LFLSEALPRDDAALSTHQVNYYKRLLAPLGKAVFPELPFLKLSDSKKEWARKFLSSTGNIGHAFTVGLNPGAIYGPAKQWSTDRFMELARRLSSDHDCEIVIFGDKNTSPLARAINNEINGKAIDTTGKTDVLQLAALLESCDILVTNDTGPMHVACAVGTSVVAIFGSTDPKITSPLGPDAVVLQKPASCSPCLKRECPEGHYVCLKNITVDDVETAVLKQLNTCR
jgi:heptosyltransferase-2